MTVTSFVLPRKQYSRKIQTALVLALSFVAIIALHWKMQPAILHGRGVGELAGPIDTPAKMIADRQMQAGGRGLTIHVTNHIQAIDGPSITRVVESPSFTRSLARSIRDNIGYLGTEIRGALA